MSYPAQQEPLPSRARVEVDQQIRRRLAGLARGADGSLREGRVWCTVAGALGDDMARLLMVWMSGATLA
jgi:hypothetical protein